MITLSDEVWATDTLRDAQDPGAGKQSWPALTRIVLERYNLIFSQVHSMGYAETGEPQHDAGTVLEDSLATLFKVTLVDGDLLLSKWSVADGLQYDDVVIVADANISDMASPSMELTAGELATIRVFYVDEDDDHIHYIESSDGGDSFGAEQSVGAASNVIAIASVSPTRVHWVSYGTDGNSRLHCYEDTGSWVVTNSLIYWPHEIEHIDAITIGDRDLIVFWSEGPMYGKYRTAGIYGVWYKHGRWSDFFHIDVLDEATSYSYRAHPMISEANGIYFLTGYLSEGDAAYSHADRFIKTSKDGEHWRQYMPLVCAEGGPAKLLVVNAEAEQSWPWSTGQRCYIVGYDRIYESDATRFVGEINASLQVDVTSRTASWELIRGIVAQANTILANHDGALDNHAIINADNTLLLKREAGYYTGEDNEYAQLTLEEVDDIKETDRLPARHKAIVSRDRMKWVRDNEADHVEERESQLIGYDIYHDNTETGYGGLAHTATQHGWWETHDDMLWLRSNNEEGLAFATWGSEIMNGQAKAWIRLEKANNNEYAGVVFRARDADNFWAAYYDQATGKILLKRKVGGSWQGIAASSSALGWSVDTWYAIMVDFRYSYFRVFYSTDGKNWTQAFTYIAGADQITGAFEYGYVGLIGRGYCDEDTDQGPNYSPPPSSISASPAPDPASGDMVGAGGLVYFLDTATGRLFRTRNSREADPAKVIYEDLGVIAAGVTHFALARWDPLNIAMACGSGGIYRCFNLNDDNPSWNRVVDLSASSDVATWVCSSPKCRKRWIVSGYDDSGGHPTPWVRTTKSNGTAWVRYDISDGQTLEPDGGREVRCEMSSHDPSKFWVVWLKWGGPQQVTFTDDWMWTSSRASVEANLNSWPAQLAPVHPYMDNILDNKALYCGQYDLGENTWTRIAYGDDDYTGLTGVNLYQGAPYNMGHCPWRDDFFWLLCYAASGNPSRLMISEDRATWTERAQWSGAVRDLDVWPSDPNLLVCGHDGTNHPLKVSSNGGYSWREQTGNWAALGYNGQIGVVEMVWLG